MCKYYLECTCNCTLKKCNHRGSEVTLWEDYKEKKVYCTKCGNTRKVRKYNYTPRVVCPYAGLCQKTYVAPVVNNDIYIVIW